MSRTVILIRHAKSSWGDMNADDHERVLNARGRASAPAVGRWLANKGYCPDIMLVSNAARTVETSDLIREAFPSSPEVIYLASLYHAAPDTLLDELKKAKQQTIALIGHNPGIALLASGLLAQPPAHSRFSDYPTGAVTVITFEEEIEPGRGICTDFIVPRDLLA